MGSANFLYDHFPVQHVLAEVMQLNRKVLGSWAKFMSVREFKCADVVGSNNPKSLSSSMLATRTSTMASGVATTRPQELHFTNWLN